MWIRAKSKVEPWCSFAIGIRLASGNPDPLPGLRDGALFLVGDPKQAIYRFRGADVNAYVRAREAIRAANPENIVSISTNFRSQPIDDRSLISTRVARVEVQPKQLVIHLTEPKATANRRKTRANGALRVPWQKTLSTRRREIFCPRECRRNMLDRSVRKRERRWSLRLPEDAFGLMNSQLTHQRPRKASRNVRIAASAKST